MPFTSSKRVSCKHGIILGFDLVCTPLGKSIVGLFFLVVHFVSLLVWGEGRRIMLVLNLLPTRLRGRHLGTRLASTTTSWGITVSKNRQILPEEFAQSFPCFASQSPFLSNVELLVFYCGTAGDWKIGKWLSPELTDNFFRETGIRMLVTGRGSGVEFVPTGDILWINFLNKIINTPGWRVYLSPVVCVDTCLLLM